MAGPPPFSELHPNVHTFRHSSPLPLNAPATPPLTATFSSKPPSFIFFPTPVPGPPLLPIQSQIPAHAPAPNPSRAGPGLPAFAAGPRRSVRMLENAFDQPWHSPPRSRGERARRRRLGWRRAPRSLQVPSSAAAILLCCTGCCGAARATWAEPDEATPLSGAVGGGAGLPAAFTASVAGARRRGTLWARGF